MKIYDNYKNIYYIKILIISMVIIYIFQCHINIKIKIIKLNDNYINIQKESNFTFKTKIKRKIKIGIYTIGLKYGGRARITSHLLKTFGNIKIFETYLFTQKIKEDNEFINENVTKRILIKKYNIFKLINEIKKKN